MIGPWNIWLSISDLQHPHSMGANVSTSTIGVFIATVTPPEDIPGLASEAESLGFGEIWVAEDYFTYGGFSGAQAALAATSSVKVGLGIVASVARHPAVSAMEIATIDRMYPGRFIPGIGHGVPVWTGQMGLTPKSPLTSLEECVSNIRILLDGGTANHEGKYFQFHDVTLAHPATTRVPLLTGVLGPKSLELSGRIADGTVMSVLAGPTYLRQAVASIEAGRAPDATEPYLVPTFALFAIDEDSAKAKAAVRPTLAAYLNAVGPHNALTGACGYNELLAELLPLGVEEVAKRMPDEWVDELTIAGDPDEVRNRIRMLLEAGATSVVLSPVDPATMDLQLKLAASTVLPDFG
jgi:5,10-methylenetetrahydromethanopterin reductase